MCSLLSIIWGAFDSYEADTFFHSLNPQKALQRPGLMWKGKLSVCSVLGVLQVWSGHHLPDSLHLVFSQPDLIFLWLPWFQRTLCPEWLCITSPGQAETLRPSGSLTLPGCGRKHFLAGSPLSKQTLYGKPFPWWPSALLWLWCPPGGWAFSCFCPVESVSFILFHSQGGDSASLVLKWSLQRVYIFFHFSEIHLGF